MINLKDDKYQQQELNPIFNGGEAGIVKNVKARVEKRKADENEKAPAYKIYFTDEKGGEINKGEFDNIDEKSDKAKDYFVNGMLHLLKESGLEPTSLPKAEYDSYSDLLNDTMKLLHKAMPKETYNVAVSFGTKAYPKRFLEVNGYWEIMNVNSARLPNMPKEALVERPEPTSKESQNNNDGSDLPFDVDEGTVTEGDLDW